MKRFFLLAVLALCGAVYADSTTVSTDSLVPRHQETITVGGNLIGVGLNIIPNFPDSMIRRSDVCKIRFQWKHAGATAFCDTTIIFPIRSRGIDTVNNGRGFRPFISFDLLPR
jgi:hypothetical protein